MGKVPGAQLLKVCTQAVHKQKASFRTQIFEYLLVFEINSALCSGTHFEGVCTFQPIPKQYFPNELNKENADL